ncbi:prion-like-(Q/N-rich) domain-bearing protein 25 [Microplitis demolitor]|uniref:prion-like-(Q/N-rich) domain-bearing protein 25 n=1 Tax=Microplitis demolitor TaxID=69319 RepID=UPI00235B5C47|nr:prion-like-(Q/N-rich) domain-bearing protein 25 [Microplitis demolitor]
MLTKHFFHTLRGTLVALTICITQVEKSNQITTNQCVKRNEICYPHHPRVCCDNNSICKPKKQGDDFICAKEDQLGSSCTIDSDCAGVKFAECSTSKICICSSNTMRVNWTTCVPILDRHCQTNNDCKVDNSECFYNQCKCKLMFKTIRNTECKRVRLGMYCRLFTDCDQYLFHSNCSEKNECECFRGYHAIDNEKCVAGFNVACRNGERCAPKNSICVNFKCQCEPRYVYRESKCVPKFLEMPCETERDCQEIKFSTCSNDKICVCKSNYGGPDLLTCSPLIGGNCSKNDDCVAQNSYCFINKCRCIANHFAYSNDLCTPLLLNKICQISNDCEHIPNSFCSRQKKCHCKDNHIAINGTKCLQYLGQVCTKNESCTTTNSICINNECQCRPNFIKHLNAECIPVRFNQSCNGNSDCPRMGQECSNQICVCKDNHIALTSTKCAPVLDGHCSKNKDCYVKKSICVENKCRCDFNHKPNSNYECEATSLGKVCLTDTDCRNIKNSKCSARNVCACEINYVAFDNLFCVSSLNGFCSDDKDCCSDTFRCFNNQCQCRTNYTAVSVDRCIETHLLRSCTTVLECSDSWHSICLPEGKCVCALNNVALRPSTCLPTLNGYCWQDDQCMAENSVCIDFRCQCKPNFIAVANNLCVSIN